MAKKCLLDQMRNQATLNLYVGSKIRSEEGVEAKRQNIKMAY